MPLAALLAQRVAVAAARRNSLWSALSTASGEPASRCFDHALRMPSGGVLRPSTSYFLAARLRTVQLPPLLAGLCFRDSRETATSKTSLYDAFVHERSPPHGFERPAGAIWHFALKNGISHTVKARAG